MTKFQHCPGAEENSDEQFTVKPVSYTETDHRIGSLSVFVAQRTDTPHDYRWHRFLHDDSFQLSIEDLACGLSTSSAALREHIAHALSPPERSQFRVLLRRHLTEEQGHTTRQQVLDKLFWELIY